MSGIELKTTRHTKWQETQLKIRRIINHLKLTQMLKLAEKNSKTVIANTCSKS